MARQMMHTTDGGFLRQQLLRPLPQQQPNVQNVYQSGGSGLDQFRPGVSPPTPPRGDDEVYWRMRHKNNEATKRCREKKRLNGVELMEKMIELNTENFVLRAQLIIIEHQFGIRGDDAVDVQQIMSMFPTDEQMSETTAEPSSATAVNSANRDGTRTPGLSALPNATEWYCHHRPQSLQEQHLELRQQRWWLWRLRQQYPRRQNADGDIGFPGRTPDDPSAPLPPSPSPTWHRPYADDALGLAVDDRPAGAYVEVLANDDVDRKPAPPNEGSGMPQTRREHPCDQVAYYPSQNRSDTPSDL